MIIIKYEYLLERGRAISVTSETEKPERDINIQHDFHNEALPFSIMHSAYQTSELMVRKQLSLKNISYLFKIFFFSEYHRSKPNYVKIKS